MTTEQIQNALKQMEEQADMNVKALLLAALVSEEFRLAGFEPVVVGGSAIEFYTDGAYMSGDTDICWKGLRLPTPAEKAAVIAKFPNAKGSPRSWQIGGLFVDLLGEITTYATNDYTSVETPFGKVVLQPVEDLIVERVFSARCGTGFNSDDDACAKKLIAACLRGAVAVDWDETARLAQLPAYRCAEALAAVKQEVAEVLATADTASDEQTMPDTTILIKPEKSYTWEQWLAGREKRRRLGNLVAPAIIRRSSSSSDKRLRAAFDGERGPPCGKPFDQQ